jgi:hypothetical protein
MMITTSSENILQESRIGAPALSQLGNSPHPHGMMRPNKAPGSGESEERPKGGRSVLKSVWNLEVLN